MAPPEGAVPPRNARWELARIRKHPAVIAETVHLADTSSGGATISFDFQTDRLIDGEPAAPIIDIEPIKFSYRCIEAIGRIAPVVLSGRDDFPRDLLHLNPTSDDRPASICLARAGLQAIYDAHGVAGVLSRLGDWFSDAKTETLFADGWEPVPSMLMEDCVLGYINAEQLQLYAASKPEGGYGYISVALTHGEANSVFLQAATPLLDTNDADQLAAARSQMALFNEGGVPLHTSIPAVFCWPASDRVESVPRFNRWTTIQAIRGGLEDTGLLEAFEEATLKFDILFRSDQQNGDKPDENKRGRRAFMLVVGLWRPAALDKTIVGIAKNAPANKLELRAFYLERPREDNDYNSKNTVVREFYGLTPTTPDILETVSGEKALPRMTLIGAGALGSAFLDYAARGGTNTLSIVDKDRLLAHNMARHRAERFHVLNHKSSVAAALCAGRAQDVDVKAINKDVLGLSSEDFQEVIRASALIIDTTADPLVRGYLSQQNGSDAKLVRSEIVHGGKLGINFLTDLNSPHTLSMLYRQLLAMAVDNEMVRLWLAYDAVRTFTDEELILGFGCRSLTTKMPAYKVDAHASSAFAFVKTNVCSETRPLIGLNALNEHGLSQGFRIITPDPIEVFSYSTDRGDWSVKVSQGVLDSIHAQRSEKAPNETGGYLFGSIDETNLEVCVVAASPEPPGTIATPGKVTIGRWGRTPFEQVLLRRTRGRLPPIGTWHSHPASAPDASPTDWATLDGFKELDAQRGLPTIMMITGAAQDRVYVVEP